MREIVICETPQDVADAAADLIFEQQSEAIASHGIYRIALSGGRTPKLLYETLVSEEWRDRMQWELWDVYWSDERAVAPDHPESNFGLAQKELLAHLPMGDVWRIRGEAGNLREAAEEYARLLRNRIGGVIEFDTIMLGMGSDGHTASLFPGHSALNSLSIVEAVETNQKIPGRVTLTLPIINTAEHIVFMVCGDDKADTVSLVLDGEDSDLPAARVRPIGGECWWLLDQAAASKIR
jgi:6-phosphogluconolactonase